MEKFIRNYMMSLEPAEAVAHHAKCAMKYGETSDYKESIELGKVKAAAMFAEGGDELKANACEKVTVSDCFNDGKKPRRHAFKVSQNDVEPGDSGSNHDEYLAAKKLDQYRQR